MKNSSRINNFKYQSGSGVMVLGRMYRQLIGTGGVNTVRINQLENMGRKTAYSREHSAALRISSQRSAAFPNNDYMTHNTYSIRPNSRQDYHAKYHNLVVTQSFKTMQPSLGWQNTPAKSKVYTELTEGVDVSKSSAEQPTIKKVRFRSDKDLVEVFEYSCDSRRSSLDSSSQNEDLSGLPSKSDSTIQVSNPVEFYNQTDCDTSFACPKDLGNRPVCIVSPTPVKQIKNKSAIYKQMPHQRKIKSHEISTFAASAKNRPIKSRETPATMRQRHPKQNISIQVNVNVDLKVSNTQSEKTPNIINHGHYKTNKTVYNKPSSADAFKRKNFITINMGHEVLPYYLRRRSFRRSHFYNSKDKNSTTQIHYRSPKTTPKTASSNSSAILKREASAISLRNIKTGCRVQNYLAENTKTRTVAPPLKFKETTTPVLDSISKLPCTKQTEPSSIEDANHMLDTNLKQCQLSSTDTAPIFNDSKTETTTQLVRIDTKALELYKQKLLGLNAVDANKQVV